jgi:NhaP-type Na+/H+ or K+/H+ antiporter
LYAAAWNTAWPDFKAAKRPITLLAIGCVIFTTCAVASVAHTFIPNLGRPKALFQAPSFSPPDAIAATASTKGLNVPKRVITVLEGESLVNDATGLIAYRYAVAAVVTRYFSIWEAGFQFVLVASGGIVLGLLMGWIFKWIHQITPDSPTTDTTLTFITPFVVYLLAESMHLSGVLAVVCCDLLPQLAFFRFIQSPDQITGLRLLEYRDLYSQWSGFHPDRSPVTHDPESIHDHSFVMLLKYGAIVSLAVIVGRILWVYPGAYLPRLSKKLREREPEVI